jgi:hypothetical protein
MLGLLIFDQILDANAALKLLFVMQRPTVYDQREGVPELVQRGARCAVTVDGVVLHIPYDMWPFEHGKGVCVQWALATSETDMRPAASERLCMDMVVIGETLATCGGNVFIKLPTGGSAGRYRVAFTAAPRRTRRRR